MGSISISNLERKKHIKSVDLHFVRKTNLPLPQILPGEVTDDHCRAKMSGTAEPAYGPAAAEKGGLAPHLPPAPLLSCFLCITSARSHQGTRGCSPDLLKAVSTL